MDEKKQEIVAEVQEKREIPMEIFALAFCFLIVMSAYGYMLYHQILMERALNYILLPAIMIAIQLLMTVLLFVPRGWAYTAIWIACIPVGLYGAPMTLFAFFFPNLNIFLPVCAIATVRLLTNSDVHIYFCGY